MLHQQILFMVELGNVHYFCVAYDRDDAIRRARSWIGSDPTNYTVTPLTEIGDRIHVALTLAT